MDWECEYVAEQRRRGLIMAKKRMSLRRDDRCATCNADLPAGTTAVWDPTARTVTCLACIGVDAPATSCLGLPVDVEPSATEAVALSEIDTGVAGASARKEHARRQAKHEAQIEARWGTGRIGRIAKALSDDPQTTRAWKEGAVGEERVAEILSERLGDQTVLLHDRKVPRTRGNIDHLVIASSGVWVVDAKRYRGKVEKRDKGGWFSTDLRLYVDGRDQTKLVGGMGWQREAVITALGDEAVPVHCALTFVGAEWPLLFRKPLRFGDVWVSWPGKLAELIDRPGTLGENDVERIARLLAGALPANRA